MEISVINTPSNAELIEALKNEFSKDYTYKEYGLGKKSVIVRKSTFLGAQITVRKNEISIHGAPPSFLIGILTSLMLTELATVIVPLFAFRGAFPRDYKKLEKETALFLKKKYN